MRILTNEATNGARHQRRTIEDRKSPSQLGFLVPAAHEQQNAGLIINWSVLTLLLYVFLDNPQNIQPQSTPARTEDR